MFQRRLKRHARRTDGQYLNRSGPRLQRRAPRGVIPGRKDQHRARAGDQARPGRRTQRAVQHDPTGLPVALLDAHVHRRIIGEHRTDAGEHRAAAGPQVLHIVACRIGGDPAALAIGQRGAPIQTHRKFDAHERPARAHALDESAVELPRRLGHEPAGDIDTRLAQALLAGPADARVGVPQRIDHARDTGANQGLGAGRRTAVMTAGLQAHVGGRTPRTRAGRRQRIGFGMRGSGTFVPALAHDLAAVDQHTADARVGVSRIEAAPRERQRARHHRAIQVRPRPLLLSTRVHGLRGALPGRPGSSGNCSRLALRRSLRRSISSRNASTSWKLR